MKSIYPLFIGLGLMVFSSCSENDPEPQFATEFNQITSFTVDDVTVTLFAEEEFFVGFNTIQTMITDRDGSLLSGDIQVTPMMQMMDMRHSSPVELPGATFEDGSFSFHTVFVMPSGEMGQWSLNFTINGTELEVPVEVTAPELTRLASFTSLADETTRYFVAFLGPNDPQVGQNDMEIAVYQRNSMMEWPAVTDVQFELEPWMVSMDHGSPNNIAPVHMEDGHYIGKVNFTMTGDWQLRLTMSRDGEVCGSPYFDLFFQ